MMKIICRIAAVAMLVASGIHMEAQEARGVADKAGAGTAGMTVVSPESEGFSSERLENLHRLIQGEIDAKELAGAVTILARHGKVVDY
ncbi:MAG TPA: hypothetical protein VHE33_01985, partial [Acidobacteriaceae bacterium]|nr:hypothetical protein [Acidobacteriaceae bacterium]